MCLGTVDLKPKRKKGVGYKVVSNDHETGGYRTGLIKGEPRPLTGEWMIDTEDEVIHGDYGDYPTGFHLSDSLSGVDEFAKRCGWYEYPVVKVEYRGVVATGKQRGYQTIVAREIRLVGLVREDSRPIARR